MKKLVIILSIIVFGWSVVFARDTQISLDKNELTLKINDTETLTATISSSGANVDVEWKSSDTDIVLVSNEGEIKALQKGNADVTATAKDGSGTATCNITVEDESFTNIIEEVQKISLNKNEFILIKISEKELISPSANNVRWILPNDSIISIDNKGVITPLKEGSVIVIAKEGSISDTCKVTVLTEDSIMQLILPINSLQTVIKITAQNTEEPTTVSEVQKKVFPDIVVDFLEQNTDCILVAIIFLLLLILLVVLYRNRKWKRKADSNKKEANQLKSQVDTLGEQKAALEEELQKTKGKLQEKESTINEQKEKINASNKKIVNAPPVTPTYVPPFNTQTQSLYADAIIEGKFNRVKTSPDEDTVFELKLNKPNDIQAIVVIYEGAYPRVNKCPEFLEGCTKHILGENTVRTSRDGIAQKDNDGRWIVKTPPEVTIN